MTGEYVTSVHSRIEKFNSGTAVDSGVEAANTPSTDPSAYLRRIQTFREQTHRWDADRLRSGFRRIAGVTYQDTIPAPEIESNLPHLSRGKTHLQMRRYRDSEIARRRQPAPKPRIGSIRGHRIVDQSPLSFNLTASAPAMAGISADDVQSPPLVDPPDLEILRRLLRTPSRVLTKGGNPWARLGSPNISDTKSPNGGPPPQIMSTTPASTRLPPVRGRLLPISMARTLRSGQQRLEDSLKATRLPYVVSTPHWHRMPSNNDHSLQHHDKQEPSCGAAMVPDLHGFRIYQHLMGTETHRVIAQRHATNNPSRSATSEAVNPESQNSYSSERHPTLPLPSFPITQILSKNSASAKTRVDYISINIAIPRADESVSQSPPPSRNVRLPSRESEGNFVPPPSPANLTNCDQAIQQEEWDCPDEDKEPSNHDIKDAAAEEGKDKD